MNAITHADGGTARIHASDNTIQVWITDRGAGIPLESIHLATLQRGFTTAGTMGHGFWIILSTIDRVFLLTGPEGTTVVLEEDRISPDPAWLRDRTESPV